MPRRFTSGSMVPVISRSSGRMWRPRLRVVPSPLGAVIIVPSAARTTATFGYVIGIVSTGPPTRCGPPHLPRFAAGVVAQLLALVDEAVEQQEGHEQHERDDGDGDELERHRPPRPLAARRIRAGRGRRQEADQARRSAAPQAGCTAAAGAASRRNAGPGPSFGREMKGWARCGSAAPNARSTPDPQMSDP